MPIDNLARSAMNAQDTGEVFLTLLTLTHPNIPVPLCFVNDLSSVVSNSVTYTAFPFDLPFPEIGTDTLPTLTLTIDNIDQSIWASLKNITTPIDVSIAWILKSHPNNIEGGPLFLRMTNTEITTTTITGTLNFEDLLNEPFPFDTYLPASAPGLF